MLVSQTVKDLVAGSGFEFEDAGEHELKGVPGAWRLYAATRAAGSARLSGPTEDATAKRCKANAFAPVMSDLRSRGSRMRPQPQATSPDTE